MPTTLTREILLDKAKPRYIEVDVPGFGVVGIRSRSRTKKDLRAIQMFSETGRFSEEAASKRSVLKIVDHVMLNESTPMFTEEDIEALGDLDGDVLEPLLSAIDDFTGEVEDEKKSPSEPSSGD